LTLEQRREIDLAKEELVTGAEQLVKDAGIASLDEKKFGHSQLRNVSAVASETESPAVVANFLRYQMGRDNRRENWAIEVAVGNGSKRIGDLFLDQLIGKDGAIAKALAKVSGCPACSTSEQLAKMEILRHFIGFTSRYVKFLDLQRKKPAGVRGNRS
jgi:hypothetical protein